MRIIDREERLDDSPEPYTTVTMIGECPTCGVIPLFHLTFMSGEPIAIGDVICECDDDPWEDRFVRARKR